MTKTFKELRAIVRGSKGVKHAKLHTTLPSACRNCAFLYKGNYCRVEPNKAALVLEPLTYCCRQYLRRK